jgi:hypothetical protein
VIYTTRFFGGQFAANTLVDLFTVPANELYIIRSVIATNATGGTVGFILNNAGTSSYMLRHAGIASNDSALFDIRQAMNAGEKLQGYGVGGGLHLVVTGYRFVL